MQFLFFNTADKPLFVRSDAEQAEWTVEEMNLHALFPYDPAKKIERGMRIGFTDETGVFQPFEIRQVKTYEPDHYQELTCEHIAIAELTDEHYAGAELTNVTAQAALSGLLAGTLWSVGTVSASGTSSGDLGMGSVWQDVRTIATNWNVYITPPVTFNATGITGRYLDISPAHGTWRGIRLSLDKNADDVGVTIDDTNTVTALYGYGATTDGAPLTFASAVWSATGGHPAKPAGQTYLEDPAATAAYGRNGRPRFGFYQNGDIKDANTLLQKTWEALKVTNAPRVTIDCTVRDLYRLGYADQPIRLHDTAMVQIRQTETNLQLEIIQLTVNLLDPTATRPTIGAYIPNIIYIQRDTAQSATGGAATTTSGRRGGGGSGGQSNREKEISEFETEITQNQYQISLRAYQRDLEHTDQIVAESSIKITSQGTQISALNTTVTSQGERITANEASITVNADKITSEVTDRTNADNVLSSTITQTANNINLRVGQNEVDIGNANTRISSLISGSSTFSLVNTQSIRLAGYSLFLGSITVDGTSYNVVRYGVGD
jgi:phage minor structural protein